MIDPNTTPDRDHHNNQHGQHAGRDGRGPWGDSLVIDGELIEPDGPTDDGPDSDQNGVQDGPDTAPDPAGPDGPDGASGELVPRDQGPRVPARVTAGTVARTAGRVAGRGTIHLVTTARTVATHERTKATARGACRHVWFPIAGAGVVLRRWRDAHGAGRYERLMRAAEAAGDREALLEWESRDVAEKQRRHDRTMDWVRSPAQLIRAAAIGTAAVTVLLLVIGIILAVAHGEVADVLAPIEGVISAVAFVAWFLATYGALLLLAATAGFVMFLWQTGRTHAEPPAWTVPTPAGEPTSDRDRVPDEGAILAALRNLNLSALNRKFKEGWVPRWVSPTTREGRGYRTQLELPAGVTVEMVNNNKRVLAHNLVRLPIEVWPTEPKRQPGVLDLFVIDPGVLTGPVDPYPLLDEGTADYFTGVPVGVDERGRPVTGALMASNYAVGGAMGSGKTSIVLNLLAGAALDPLVEIEVYVLAHNVDYNPFTKRASALVKGDEDEHIARAIDALRNLRGEVTEKGRLLAELGGEETKLTRELAERDPRMRPKVVVFDECQELFRHPEFGAEAKELAIKVMMKARKCGITLVFVTPAPSADSLPRDLAKTASHRVCFAIGDHQGNDAILGTGAHSSGITAVHLVPGEDVGTAMASGFGPRPGLLRSYHIRKDKQVDELTPIVERAIAARDGQEAAQAPAVGDAEPEPDVLADVAAVLVGHKRMRTQEVLSHLAARDRRRYGRWTFPDLADALPDEAKPYKSDGVMVVSTARVGEALADRDQRAGDEHDPDDPDDGLAGVGARRRR